MLHIRFKWELSSICQRAHKANILTEKDRNELMSKAYAYAKQHPAPYIPALVVLMRIRELDDDHIESDAMSMVDEFFEIPNGNRPDYFEAEENYKNFLIVYITPGF